MRLIDADENRESFKKIVYCVLKNDFLTSKDKFNQIMIAFDSISTAYDIDKVVEELEKAKDEIASEDYCRSINDKEKCDSRNCFKCCAEYLIEIVKQGGVSDDVCEAKQGRWVFDKFTAKYGKPYRCNCCSEEFGDTYNYCPNCGVGMKEVE